MMLNHGDKTCALTNAEEIEMKGNAKPAFANGVLSDGNTYKMALNENGNLPNEMSALLPGINGSKDGREMIVKEQPKTAEGDAQTAPTNEGGVPEGGLVADQAQASNFSERSILFFRENDWIPKWGRCGANCFSCIWGAVRAGFTGAQQCFL